MIQQVQCLMLEQLSALHSLLLGSKKSLLGAQSVRSISARLSLDLIALLLAVLGSELILLKGCFQAVEATLGGILRDSQLGGNCLVVNL